MRVTVLGSSGMYAAPGDACSGYLVQHDGVSVLLDAGPGVLANLGRHVPIESLSAIVLSHAHPDHWMELPVLMAAYRHVFDRSGCALLASESHLAVAERLAGGPLLPTFAPQVIADGSEVTVGQMRLRFSRTAHPSETLAVRVESDEAAIGYTADTGPAWSLSELGDDLALAICESTYLDRNKVKADGIHLTAWEAGALGRLANVGQLVLTHFLPGSDRVEYGDEATESFGAPVHLAKPHLRFEVRSVG